MRSKLAKLTLAACIALSAFSCSDDEGGDNSSKGRASCPDGTYEGVTIGTQTWMAKNLNCNLAESECYDYDPENCAKYGRLYTWEAAMSACPKGWHLPTDDEWSVLADFAGDGEGARSSKAANRLKSTSGWGSNGNSGGTDDYGFTGLPGGEGRYGVPKEKVFVQGGIGRTGNFWLNDAKYNKCDDFFERCPMIHLADNSSTQGLYDGHKDNMYSVRCIKD